MGKFYIIGGGNMGAAFAALSLEKQLYLRDDIIIVERSEERRKYLEEYLGVNVLEYLPSISEGILLLAVKPQEIKNLCVDLKNKISPDVLILSIMAGVKTTDLSLALNNHKKIVRCMPNMPLQIGCGMTGYFVYENSLNKNEEVAIERLLSVSGKFFKVNLESDLDGVTAISGSGPAYVFYFIEALLKAAEELGFSASEAKIMVEETFLGSLKLFEKSQLSVAELRKKVTSKGGTTEAALNIFNEKELFQSIISGVKAAHKRSQQLG